MSSAKEKGSTQVILIREFLLLFSIASILITAKLFLFAGLSSIVLLGGGLAFVLFAINLLLIPFDRSGSSIGENLNQTGILGIMLLLATSVMLWASEVTAAIGIIAIDCVIILYALLDGKRRE